MESTKYSLVLISELIQQYRENIKNKYQEQKGYVEQSINNVKGIYTNIYNNIYENITNKIQIPYTHEDLNSEKNTTNKKIKEYGMFLDTYNNFYNNKTDVLDSEN